MFAVASSFRIPNYGYCISETGKILKRTTWVRNTGINTFYPPIRNTFSGNQICLIFRLKRCQFLGPPKIDNIIPALSCGIRILYQNIILFIDPWGLVIAISIDERSDGPLKNWYVERLNSIKASTEIPIFLAFT